MEKVTILVVDDEQFFLETIVDELNSIDYKVLQAKNGREGLKVAEKFLPDIVITDWEMPEMNGIEMIKAFKKRKIIANIPIIMCTGIMTSSKDLKIALDAGAVDYIRKPIDKTELQARVSSMLKLSESYKEIKLLNATKDKFFSIIAHDLKSPFNALLGLSNLLLENHVNHKEEKRERYIKLINDSSIKTYKLLENLLVWAQSQSGSIELLPEKITIKALINEIALLFEETRENKNIIFSVNTEENLFVFADKNMIETVIRNLISNALKFTPQRGEIIVNAKTITDENNQKIAKITVKDSGVGISPEIQSKLFDIRDNSSTKGTENETGAGLGLILCREFVEKHDCKIWVESEVGNLPAGKAGGSNFSFTLPLYKNQD